MNDAQQEMSPDFVLMRLVSAAEYDRLDEPDDLMSGGGGFGPVKPALGHRGGPSPGLGSASPHYSSPLPGRSELSAGAPLTGSDAPLSPPLSPPEDFVDFPVQHGSGMHGSTAQLMVFQNLLRSGDRILEEAERQRQQLDSGAGPKDQNSVGIPSAEEQLLGLSDGPLPPQQDVPALDCEPGSVLCQRHRLLTDRLAKWPPGLLDQALRLGLLDRKSYSSGGEEPVLALARRLGQLGEGREGGRGETAPSLSRCSCHSVLGSGTPGEDPGETSDALLVLEGLGSEEEGGTPCGGAGPAFSSGTLSGLMLQVHRLAEEAGVCTDQGCRSSLAVLGATVSPPPCADPRPPSTPGPHLPALSAALQASSSPVPPRRPQYQSRSQPQSRAATPKLGVASGGARAGRCSSPLVVLQGEETLPPPRGKARKGGSLKVRLSKLFRTKSSSGGSAGLLDKRPSLASSTSSGGSLLDVWGSTGSNTEPDATRLQISRPHSAFSPVTFTPAFTGETVSLVDVDISRRGVNSLHPPTPPPPPRRSLSLLDDFGAPPQHHGPFGASMQSLPPRPLALPPSLSTIQHSLSLNDTFLRVLPRPVPLRPDVWLVLGSDELGGRRDEAEGETGRILSGPGQFRPAVHPESELQVAGSHTPHTHGALQSTEELRCTTGELVSFAPMISSMLDPCHKHLGFLTPTQSLAANAELVALGEAVETGRAAIPQAGGDEAALSDTDQGSANTGVAGSQSSAMA
ncbi:hypothetical protein PFLUV_G00184790 [Perca fluviatilis]|uniref:Suppressor of cytokine signaling 7 n=1 Tax=Perca fluviatilis TaxID=8168 RepID=A0A6A5DYG1_PERFL|nr:hypothetical protein PFLUV_G00184790 [Perca fluviatilis]